MSARVEVRRPPDNPFHFHTTTPKLTQPKTKNLGPRNKEAAEFPPMAANGAFADIVISSILRRGEDLVVHLVSEELLGFTIKSLGYGLGLVREWLTPLMDNPGERALV
jgi:hypothetical protein